MKRQWFRAEPFQEACTICTGPFLASWSDRCAPSTVGPTVRLITLALFVVGASLLLVRGGGAAQPLCGSKSSYDSGYRMHVAELRWSLFALSQLKQVEDHHIDFNEVLPGLANGSVFALTNLFSERARYVQQGCIKVGDLKAYRARTSASRRFIALLITTTSSPGFPAVAQIQKSRPDLVFWDSPPSLVDVSFDKFDKRITDPIGFWKHEAGREGQSATTLSVVTAALWGNEARFDEHGIALTKYRFETNPETDDLRKSPYSVVLAHMRETGWETALVRLSNYYLPPHSIGKVAGL